jgi:hypothetical protein
VTSCGVGGWSAQLRISNGRRIPRACTGVPRFRTTLRLSGSRWLFVEFGWAVQRWLAAHQTRWHPIANRTTAKTAELARIERREFRTIGRSPRATWFNADLRTLRRDFVGAFGAFRRRLCTRLCNDFRDGLSDQGATTFMTGGELFQPFNFFVCRVVDLIEPRACVIDELSNLIYHLRHRVVKLRLVHDGHAVSHVLAMHGLDRVAGVVGEESVCPPAYRCGGVSVIARFPL